ncbi:MAG: hypothetical protein HOH96_07605 [Flavobacteriales bacterium]|nr:hypothetical protein [Flavobacteriales bacterium]
MDNIKRAFYPCCFRDFIQSRDILAEYLDEIIFCDIFKHPDWDKVKSKDALPKVRLVIEDAREYLKRLPIIDVFFHRNDGYGEGGSGIPFLSPRVLVQIVSQFPAEGGLIITDGKNSRGHIFKKMLRSDGYFRKEWGLYFQLEKEQPFYKKHSLQIIRVTPHTEEKLAILPN